MRRNPVFLFYICWEVIGQAQLWNNSQEQRGVGGFSDLPKDTAGGKVLTAKGA